MRVVTETNDDRENREPYPKIRQYNQRQNTVCHYGSVTLYGVGHLVNIGPGTDLSPIWRQATT